MNNTEPPFLRTSAPALVKTAGSDSPAAEGLPEPTPAVALAAAGGSFTN